MGERIVEIVGEGKVALFIATPGQLNIQPRIDGALDAIAESGANIEAEDIASGPLPEEQLNVIEAWYLGNTDAVGMFAVDATSTAAIAQIVQSQSARDQGLIGAGGYDLVPTTVELLAQGVLDFTIDQQPYLQGFLPVLYLYLSKLSGGVVLPPETNTGLVFLDQAAATAVPRHARAGSRATPTSRRSSSRSAPGGTGDHRRLTAARRSSTRMTDTAESEASGESMAVVQPAIEPVAKASAVSRAADLISRRRETSIAFVAVVLFVYFWITTDAFFTSNNLRVVTQFTTPVAMLAIAQVMNLVGGEIDLSLGNVYALTPFVMISAQDWGLPLPVALGLRRHRGVARRVDQRGDHVDDRGPVVHHHARHAVLPQRLDADDLRRVPQAGAAGRVRRMDRRCRLLRLLVGGGIHGRAPHRAHQHAVGCVHDRHRR